MTSILCICSGNICRSPAAEALLRDRLGDLATVSSAGTQARAGQRMPREMRAALKADALASAVRGHRATPVSRSLVGSADLIIAMAWGHRDYVQQLAPSVAGRVFTLAELAALSRDGVRLRGSSAAERLADVPRAALAHRALLDSLVLWDVEDPYGGPREGYEKAYRIIRHSVNTIDEWVRDAALAA